MMGFAAHARGISKEVLDLYYDPDDTGNEAEGRRSK